MPQTATEQSNTNLDALIARIGLPREVLTDAVLEKIATEPLFLHHLQLCKQDPAMLRLLLQEVPQQHSAADTVRSIELIGRVGVALARWSTSGFQKVDNDVYAQRLATCRACEHLSVPGASKLYRALGATKRGEASVCGLCGCDVKRKAWMATERCPDNRWADAE